MHDEILITGACGFLGRHTARRLMRQGYRVRGIGHGDCAPGGPKSWGLAEWHSADVTTESLDRWAGTPYALIHCAGSGAVSGSFKEPLADFRRTVSTTVEVLEYVRRRSPCTRIIYPSSASVYGMASMVPTPESSCLAPVSLYGVHKAITERLIAAHAQYFHTQACVIRFFSIYGNGLRKQLLWDACRTLAIGDRTFAGTGQEVRDWLHVDDAAALLSIAIGAAASTCPVINGGTGEGRTVRELITHLAGGLGQDHAELKFTGERRDGDPSRYIADIERARNLGWRPQRQWEESVAEYAAWWLHKSEIQVARCPNASTGCIVGGTSDDALVLTNE